MFDALIVSDIHLGSENCLAKSLCELLEEIAEERIVTARLILNGDVFDSIDFRRLTKSHWKVLSLIRKLSDHVQIIWIAGNHDGSADIISHLLGVTVMDECVLESGSERILILHGHIFDDFLDAHPILTWIGDCIYFWLQRIDDSHSFAKMAKKGSKTFLRCAQKVREGAIERARKVGCTAVCCGHTHHALVEPTGPIAYYNGGCWTERLPSYLTIKDGAIDLRWFDDTLASQEVAAEAPPLRLLSTSGETSLVPVAQEQAAT